MLSIQDVSKTYHGQSGVVRALEGVSLTAAPGEFVGVQGRSGCGKTTLLLAAGGLLTPTEGTVRVDGRDVYALSPDERAGLRASTIGFVFQQFHLIGYLTVLENVLAASLPATPRGSAVPNPGGGNHHRARAEALIERFGLTGRRNHLPTELSTGERQRTALARALLNGPRLLLADEPTGNLDEINAGEVYAELRRFADEGGTVLLVTHDDRAAANADRTIQLRDGRTSTPT